MAHAERAAAVKDQLKALAADPESGFHPSCKGKNGGPIAPEHQGKPAITTHVVVFPENGRTHTLAGDCAKRVSAAMTAWLAKPRRPLDEARAFNQIDAIKHTVAANTTPDKFVVQSGDWNAVLDALAEMGIGVTQADIAG